jgi:hypothetical protein
MGVFFFARWKPEFLHLTTTTTTTFIHLTTKSTILIYFTLNKFLFIFTLNKLFFFYYFTHNRFSSPPLLKFETLSSVSTTISSRFIKNQFHLLHLHCSSIPFEKSLISSPIYKNPNSQFENPNQFHRFCSIRFHVRLCFSSISVRFYLCSIRKPKPVFHVRFCFCVRLWMCFYGCVKFSSILISFGCVFMEWIFLGLSLKVMLLWGRWCCWSRSVFLSFSGFKF